MQEEQTIYYDFEFIEDGSTIDIISIGGAKPNGEEYYAVNKDCDFSKADDWVLDNVLRPMGLDRRGFDIPEQGHRYRTDNFKQTLACAKTKHEIAREVILFVLGDYEAQNYFDWPLDELKTIKPDVKTALWGYYPAYDHVALCQLYGTMMMLPKCLPMFTKDIKQLCDSLGDPELPAQGKGEHNALTDAKWNMEAHQFLKTYSQRRRIDLPADYLGDGPKYHPE